MQFIRAQVAGEDSVENAHEKQPSDVHLRCRDFQLPRRVDIDTASLERLISRSRFGSILDLSTNARTISLFETHRPTRKNRLCRCSFDSTATMLSSNLETGTSIRHIC